MDAFSGTSAMTTVTGTVSLAFLPDGGSLVRIRRIGYEPVSMMVVISPTDTVPITLALHASATKLPAVVTRDSAARLGNHRRTHSCPAGAAQ